MDAAQKRTTDVHRSQLKQKELEILELQRVIAAKERSIDSLRDTLATTKRTYESRLSQAESASALKDVEVRNLGCYAAHARCMECSVDVAVRPAAIRNNRMRLPMR